MRPMLILLFVLIGKIAFSQNTSSLSGLGKFKINETVVTDLPKMFGVEPVKLDNKDYFKYASGYKSVGMLDTSYKRLVEAVYGITKDIKYPVQFVLSHELVPGYRIFLLNYFSTGGIGFENTKLLFFNDTLISIEGDKPKDLEEALSYRYGKVEPIYKSDTIACKDDYGLASNKVQIEKTSRWANGSIEAVCYISLKYDSKCKKNFSSIYFICDTKKKDAYRSKMLDYFDVVIDRENAVKDSVKKEKYRDFR